jgi:hypothetical protein
MTDKQYSQQKKRVGSLIDKWKGPLGIGWYHVKLVWSRAYSEDNVRVMAVTETTWQYRQAVITWYLPTVLEETDEDFLESVVVHELCHILLAPLAAAAGENDTKGDSMDVHEYATECVAQALIHTRNSSLDKRSSI